MSYTGFVQRLRLFCGHHCSCVSRINCIYIGWLRRCCLLKNWISFVKRYRGIESCIVTSIRTTTLGDNLFRFLILIGGTVGTGRISDDVFCQQSMFVTVSTSGHKHKQSIGRYPHTSGKSFLFLFLTTGEDCCRSSLKPEHMSSLPVLLGRICEIRKKNIQWKGWLTKMFQQHVKFWKQEEKQENDRLQVASYHNIPQINEFSAYLRSWETMKRRVWPPFVYSYDRNKWLWLIWW